MATVNQTIDEKIAVQVAAHFGFKFEAEKRAKGEGVEVSIQLVHCTVPVHIYVYEMHPRDLDHPQFEWSFQRQLYDALHDYFVEMFIRTPQDQADRQRKGL